MSLPHFGRYLLFRKAAIRAAQAPRKPVRAVNKPKVVVQKDVGGGVTVFVDMVEDVWGV